MGIHMTSAKCPKCGANLELHTYRVPMAYVCPNWACDANTERRSTVEIEVQRTRPTGEETGR
jgi:hypothetical protein